VKWFLWTLMIFGVVYSFFGVFQADTAYSGEMSDEMKKMQEQLNNQVVSKPFSVADKAQVKPISKMHNDAEKCHRPIKERTGGRDIPASIYDHIPTENT
jgi:sortase (surface protein transpeptidase)